MIQYEDECVGCKSMGLPCYGDACPNRNVPHIYCDKCGEEIDEDEWYEDDEYEDLCEDCLKEKYRKTEVDL